MKEPIPERFCQCIKKVRKTIKHTTAKEAKKAEGRAIAICVKSVIQRKGKTGKTLKRFSCRNKVMLEIQNKK